MGTLSVFAVGLGDGSAEECLAKVPFMGMFF